MVFKRTTILIFSVLAVVFGRAGFSADSAVVAGPPPAEFLPDETHEEVFLWPEGAPGSEGQTGEGVYRIEGDKLVISSIHAPSVSVFKAKKDVATDAGVLVIPGGGFYDIWITHEGYRVAEWLSEHGITAFVLKYRLQNAKDSTYTVKDHALPDMQRAIRLIRSRAEEFGVDPERLGVLGFSAGGVLAGLAGTHHANPIANPQDEIDELSAKPAFLGLIYGTPFRISEAPEIEVPEDMPAVFLLAGADDDYAKSFPEIYSMLKAAGVSTELHLYAGVGHGFGIQPENPPAVAGWINRFQEWLMAIGMLTDN